MAWLLLSTLCNRGGLFEPNMPHKPVPSTAADTTGHTHMLVTVCTQPGHAALAVTAQAQIPWAVGMSGA